MTYTIQQLRDKNLIIFEAKMGSHAYGTSLPTSDIDIRGVFIQPLEDVLKYGWVEQVSDEKHDVIFYEIGRFMHLLIGSNPNITELLEVPEDCVIYKHPLYEEILQNKSVFLSKKLKLTFAGYAIAQIQKQKSKKLKLNWEENNIKRKNVLDFCYVLVGGQTELLKEFLNKTTCLTQDKFGLSLISHTRCLYAMYEMPFELIKKGEKWGLVSDEETANDVKLTSIPKGTFLHAYLSFDKDAYSSHCTRYAEYQEWLKNRNPDRFRMNKEHGKNYDSKNMAHTYRLLLMAHELAKGILKVRRDPEEIEKILKIRKGEYEYEDLLREAEAMRDSLDEAYEKSTLPDRVDSEKAYDILFAIRKHFYGI